MISLNRLYFNIFNRIVPRSRKFVKLVNKQSLRHSSGHNIGEKLLKDARLARFTQN